MVEKNKEAQTAKDRVADALSQALAEDLGEIPKVSITIEELKALEQADRRKRTKRRIRYLSMAAAVVIIFAAALYAFWPKTAVPVSADKNTEQKVEREDGMIVINEGNVEGEQEAHMIIEEDWNKVLGYKNSLPELYIPGYVPKGYRFDHSELNKYPKSMYDITYVYKNDKNALSIKYRYLNANSDKATAIDDQHAHIESTRFGKAYIYTDTDTNGQIGATIHLNKGVLAIRGQVKSNEMVRMINGMQRGCRINE